MKCPDTSHEPYLEALRLWLASLLSMVIHEPGAHRTHKMDVLYWSSLLFRVERELGPPKLGERPTAYSHLQGLIRVSGACWEAYQHWKELREVEQTRVHRGVPPYERPDKELWWREVFRKVPLLGMLRELVVITLVDELLQPPVDPWDLHEVIGELEGRVSAMLIDVAEIRRLIRAAERAPDHPGSDRIPARLRALRRDAIALAEDIIALGECLEGVSQCTYNLEARVVQLREGTLPHNYVDPKRPKGVPPAILRRWSRLVIPEHLRGVFMTHYLRPVRH